MIRLAVTAFTAVSFGLMGLSAVGGAHEGHDEAAEPAVATPAAPRLAAEGADLELVATAHEHTLTLYLDRIATNAPVHGATIDVMGDGIPRQTAKEIGNGTYALEADWVHEPGVRALTFVVAADGVADLLAGVLTIPEDAEEHDPASPWVALLAEPLLWLVALTVALGGFVLGFVVRPVRLPPDAADDEARASSATAARSLGNGARIVLVALAVASAAPRPSFAHEGHDHAGEAAPVRPAGGAPLKLPSGEVFLPKASQRLLEVRTIPAASEKTQAGAELVGTVIADPSHEGRVQAPMDGQIELASGEVSYVGKAVAAGDVLALLAPAMPVYERGTLAQVTADVEGKLRIAEQKLQRLTRISGDYIPQREIEDTRTEIESLREQKRVLAPKNTERLELKAPVDGIISLADVRAGQVVSARDTLFEIVDPGRLWIEAIGTRGTDDRSAVATAVAVDAEGHRIPLSFVGRAPALRQQALPLLFKVDEPHASLGIGATVKVLIRHGAPVDGIVVPEGAVVRAPNGLPQVWVKVAPERFAPRAVRTLPLDGERVVVTSGLSAGDRVVVEAAALINQVR